QQTTRRTALRSTRQETLTSPEPPPRQTSRLPQASSQRIQRPVDLSRSSAPPAPCSTRHTWERGQEQRSPQTLPSIPRVMRISPEQLHPHRRRERTFSSQN